MEEEEGDGACSSSGSAATSCSSVQHEVQGWQQLSNRDQQYLY